MNYDNLVNTHKMIKLSHLKDNIVKIYVTKNLKFNIEENFCFVLIGFGALIDINKIRNIFFFFFK